MRRNKEQARRGNKERKKEFKTEKADIRGEETKEGRKQGNAEGLKS